MSRLKRHFAVAALGLVGIAAVAGFSQPADAHGYVSFGIGLPGFGYVAPPPAYYAPPPVYYAPAPAYYGPPVVYGAPYGYGRPYYHPYHRVYWGPGYRHW